MYRLVKILLVAGIIITGLLGVTPVQNAAQGQVVITSVGLSSEMASVKSGYTLEFTVPNGIVTGDTVTVTFPPQTDLSDLSFDVNSGLYNVGMPGSLANVLSVTVLGQQVILSSTVPVNSGSSCIIQIHQGAGIVNPALSKEAADGVPGDLYKISARTQRDASDSFQYDIIDWVGAYPTSLAQNDSCTVWGAGFSPGATIRLNTAGGPVDGSGVVGRNGMFEFVGYSTGRAGTLTATDGTGRTANMTGYEPSLPPNQPPFAAFEFVVDSEVVTCIASNSNDNDGVIISWEWDFGDGETGSGMEVEHAFVTEGDYHVVLTVQDNRGAVDAETKAVKIIGLAEPPVSTGTEQVVEDIILDDVVIETPEETSEPDEKSGEPVLLYQRLFSLFKLLCLF